MTLKDVVTGEDLALRLYGIKIDSQAAKNFFEFVTKWFDDLGYPPNKLAIKAPGHSGKVISFARGKNKLSRNGFDNISTILISSLAEDGTHTSFHHLIEAMFSDFTSRLVIRASTKIESLSLDSFLPAAKILIQDFQPDYGIIWRFYRQTKSDIYESHQRFSREYGEESTRLHKWDDYDLHLSLQNQGLIRGVYPFNFLNSSQLQMPVEGVSLSDWIQQDPQRGTLEPIDERLTLWRVPEEAIPAIRDILWKTGQIFDWNKYCPPPLSPEEAEEFIRRSQACIEAEIAAELGTAPKPGMGYQVLYDAEGREVRVYGPPPQD